MFIKELFRQKCFTLSFEFFPPKREGNLDSLFTTIQELSTLKPDFISVTYGNIHQAGSLICGRNIPYAFECHKWRWGALWQELSPPEKPFWI